MQNEELQKTHQALEAARDCFKNLYNLAPVGFMALNRDELITEINQTGCNLLGIDPNKLNNLRFSSFVANENRDDWYRLFRQMFHTNSADKKRLDLQLIRSDGWTFKVHLICVFLPCSEIIATPILRLAFTDIAEVEPLTKNPQ
jgi:PAS domain S-box-containing protein